MSFFQPIRLAFELLTRIPINSSLEVKQKDIKRSIYWYFVPALVVGCFSAVAYLALYKADLLYLACLSAVLIPIFITGALHVDGLGDVCDAIFSSRDRTKMLEIMKDPTMGTMGVLAIAINLLVRFVLLLELTRVISPYAVGVLLLITPISGKVSLITGGAMHGAAREDGLGKAYIDSMNSWHMVVVSIVVATLLCVIFNPVWAGLVLVPIISGMIASSSLANKFSGLTGDALGALNELGEIVFLLVVLLWCRI